MEGDLLRTRCRARHSSRNADPSTHMVKPGLAKAAKRLVIFLKDHPDMRDDIDAQVRSIALAASTSRILKSN